MGTASFVSSPGWVEANDFYGKSSVVAGQNDETVLTANGLDTVGDIFANGDLDIDDIFADAISAASISAQSKTFRIDHPLDPSNKVLNHWSIESDEMRNLYDGVTVLDERGEAVVTFPKWFDGLNREFTYQLTAIGRPGAGLYVAQEISNGQFRIAGGTPKLKVSWQVTGIRKDASAVRHRKPVEQEKTGDDRGRYVDPEAFGKAKSQRVGQQGRPTRPATSPRPEPASKSKASLTPGQFPSESVSTGLACLRPTGEVRKAALPVGIVGVALGLGAMLRGRRNGRTR